MEYPIQARLKSRPTRIGFLVRPSDKKSLGKIAAINSRIWGGVCNPIVPVFKKAPTHWQDDHPGVTNQKTSIAYLNFFEPDVIVEAEKGLLGQIGLKDFSEDRSGNLNNFWTSKQKPRFSCGIEQYYSHVFETEEKFSKRAELNDKSILFSSARTDLNGAMCFGDLHKVGSRDFTKKSYKGVYNPEEVTNFEKAWKAKYLLGFNSPLSITGEEFESLNFDVSGVRVFIYDPKSGCDLIDFWNMRVQLGSWVIPFPTSLINNGYSILQELLDTLINQNIAIDIEISRSLKNSSVQKLVHQNIQNPKNFPISYKMWMDKFWNIYDPNSQVSQNLPVHFFLEEEWIEMATSNTDHPSFRSLTPKFIKYSGDNRFSWINTLRVKDQHFNHGLSTTLPFSTLSGFDWNIDLIRNTKIGSEGWIFPLQYSNSRISLKKKSPRQCIEEHFAPKGLQVSQSVSGKITHQIFDTFSQSSFAFIGTSFLASRKRIEFLNKFAMSRREVSKNEQITEDLFASKPIKVSELKEHINRTHGKGSSVEAVLRSFKEYKILRLGLSVTCSNCDTRNWFGLDNLDYKLTCDFCIKEFEFPEHKLSSSDRDWEYRLVGPYSSPDYARGAYSAILTARLLDKISGYDDQLTFEAGIKFQDKDKEFEADLVGWIREDGPFDYDLNPHLFFAECKSFGEPAVKKIDTDRMADLAREFQEAVLVISVLKPDYSTSEKKRLNSFVKKYSHENTRTKNYRPIIILTGKDLFFESRLPSNRYSDSDLRSLRSFAKKTHKLNL